MSGEETSLAFLPAVLGFLAPEFERLIARVGLKDLVVPTIVNTMARFFPWMSLARYMWFLQALYFMAFRPSGGGRHLVPNGWSPGALVCDNPGGTFSTSIGNATFCHTLGGPIDPNVNTSFGVIGEWQRILPTNFSANAYFTRQWSGPAGSEPPYYAVSGPGTVAEELQLLGSPGISPGQAVSLFPHLAPIIGAQPEPLPLSTAAVALSPGFRDASYASEPVPSLLPRASLSLPPGIMMSEVYTGVSAMPQALAISDGGGDRLVVSTTRPLAPFRQPRGRKEVKLRGSVHGLRILLMGATYGGMFVRSLFQALPWKDRSRSRSGRRTYASMLRDLADHIGDVDWRKATVFVAEGVVKYAAEGAALRQINRATRYSAAGQGYGLATNLYHAMGPDVAGPYGGFQSPHGGAFSGRQDPFEVLTHAISEWNKSHGF
jgi:hypothetical protein